MTHTEHVYLIHQAFHQKGGVWADLGSGGGAFTLALRDLAGSTVEIYSVDNDQSRLDTQQEKFAKQFPDSNIHFITADFTHLANVPLLDGVVMANSLHYVKNQASFLTSLKQQIKPGGKLILVEYNIDKGNPWVPYPLSYETFAKLMEKTGFMESKLLKKIPSAYWEEMYSAEAKNS